MPRGGKREGAGRRPLPPGQKSTRAWVFLTPAELAHIKALGNGNLSEGIRRLLKGENDNGKLD
jgi:hypothetical protein